MVAAIGRMPDITAVQPLEALETKATAASGGAVFQSVFDAAVKSVQGAQETASKAVGAVLEGKGGELHSAILATQRAELQFQLMLQYRNKIVNAYQEVMKVQL